jgi:4-hydroxy-4-methyl-2-oxoglutarate aldolase
VTALTQPGDNWMIHVAAEQCRAGDVLVVACTTDNTDGMLRSFGDFAKGAWCARLGD